MKYLYIFAVLALVACGSLTSHAQPGAGSPTTKIAIVDTEMFGDPKAGVRRLVAAYEQIEREFKPRRDEIQAQRVKYDALVKSINDTKAVADPKALAAKADEVETIKSDIERKQQDGQKAIEKRSKELTDPIYADVSTALQAYAKSRGIDMVLDISKFAGAAMIINQAMDITSAFINEYNAKNPGVPAGLPVK